MLTKLLLGILLLAVSCENNSGDGSYHGPPEPTPEEPTPEPLPEPLPPTPPKPPEPLPPPEDREETKTCAFKWVLDGEPAGRFYDLEYVAVITKTKDVHASFSWGYVVGSASTEKQTASLQFPAGEKVAEISTLTWRASLAGSGAKFKNVALNEERTAPCK